MGGNNYSKTVQNITQKTLVDAGTEVMRNNTSYTSQVVNANQNVAVSIQNSTINCPISIDQTQNVTVELVNEFSADTQSKLENKMDELMETSILNAVDQTNQGLAFGRQNTSISESTVNMIKDYDFSTKIAEASVNRANQEVSNIQDVDFEVIDSEINCPPGEGITIRQTINLEAIFSNAFKTTALSEISNDITTKSVLDIENQVTQKNAGLLNFPDLFGFLGGLLALMSGVIWIKLAIAIIKYMSSRNRARQRISFVQPKIK